MKEPTLREFKQFLKEEGINVKKIKKGKIGVPAKQFGKAKVGA
jgi:hypothetical protein